MLLEQADPDDPRTLLLEKIERQTFRAAKIVNGLLTLSRPGTPGGERTLVDMNVVIADVFSLLEHQFEIGKIRIRRELCEQPATVLAIEHQLQQVFLNLFLNAKDAMAEGGTLHIRARVVSAKVEVVVSDTGVGISRENIRKIYDPFFTTKSGGKGTGLGLSVSYGIVQEHGGIISVESKLGSGTSFKLEFPLARKAVHV